MEIASRQLLFFVQPSKGSYFQWVQIEKAIFSRKSTLQLLCYDLTIEEYSIVHVIKEGKL